MTAYKKHRSTHLPYGRVLTREERELLMFVARKRDARQRQLERSAGGANTLKKICYTPFMPELTTIQGGSAEFLGEVNQMEQGCKAIYTLGDQTYFILLDDAVVAVDDSIKVGSQIKAIPPGTKGRIEAQEDNGKVNYVLVLY